MRDAKHVLIVFSVFIAVMSGGTPISLGWMFHRAETDVVIFGSWSVDDGYLFSTALLVAFIVSLINTLLLLFGEARPQLRWTLFSPMFIASCLVAVADFFWLPLLLVALMALTGVYLATAEKARRATTDETGRT